MAKSNHKVGDKVECSLLTLGGKKKKVKGTIKKIDTYYGWENYTVTQGVVEDFTTKSIK